MPHETSEGPNLEGRRDLCPRCHAGRLRPWAELSDEEREVARRLAAPAKLSVGERAAHSLWCPRCWHEETNGAPCVA